jgi:uncharacterized membrane protein YfcA
MIEFLIATAAFIAAALNSMAGGGTFLTFPALTGIAGLSEKVANMTSTVGLWPGAAASVAAAGPEFRRVPRGLLIAYGVISLLGGMIGAWLLIHTSQTTFRLIIPWLLAFATFVFAFSKRIARWAGRTHGDRSLKWTLLVGVIQFAVAIYGGYFGAGIGILMMAGFSFAGFDDVHQANALKVLLGTFINGVSVIIFMFGPVNWRLAGFMVVTSTFGGFLGMALARRIKPTQLRLIILAVAVILTTVYFAKAYGPALAR